MPAIRRMQSGLLVLRTAQLDRLIVFKCNLCTGFTLFGALDWYQNKAV